MITTDPGLAHTERLWAGEIRLTVYVPRELTASDAQNLVVSLASLAQKIVDVSNAVLPPGCKVETHIS